MTESQNNSPSSNTPLIPFSETEKLLDAYVSHKQLFLFKEKGSTAIFRLLTIGELEAIRAISKVCNVFSIEDWVIEKAGIYVSPNILAGTSSKLAKIIIKKSDASDEKTYVAVLNHYREKTTTLEMVSQSMINRVFPTLDLSAMSFDIQARYLALSELMLNSKIDIGQPKKKGKPQPKMPSGFTTVGGAPSAEASRILSPEAADKPDFAKDNAQLRGL